MAIEIPEGVGAVSVAVVGYARILLRSDQKLHCVDCDQVVAHDWTGVDVVCQHLRDLGKRGLVRLARDEEGRVYPEWVWHRGGGKIASRWPALDDPDDARGILAGVLSQSMPRGWRRVDEVSGKDTCRDLAETVLANLRAKGYAVMPEWLGKPRAARHVPSGRGFRALDLEGE